MTARVNGQARIGRCVFSASLCAQRESSRFTQLCTLLDRRRFLFRFDRPHGKEIRRHQFDDFFCLTLGIESAVIVFPFKFLEIVSRVALPDSVVVPHATADPRPHFFGAVVMRKSMKLSATNEARISLDASRCILCGAECVEMKDGFIVFQRIDVHVPVFLKLDPEDGYLSLLRS